MKWAVAALLALLSLGTLSACSLFSSDEQEVTIIPLMPESMPETSVTPESTDTIVPTSTTVKSAVNSPATKSKKTK